MRNNSIQKLREDLHCVDTGVSNAFSKVREELNTHLDSINQNTAELNIAYQYIASLESKIEKLSERLDELTVSKSVTVQETSQITNLSIREQEIFLVLYTAKDKLSATSVARLLGLSLDQSQVSLARLEAKGIPVKKIIYQDELVFYLEREFKDLQARRSLVPIHDSLLQRQQHVPSEIIF